MNCWPASSRYCAAPIAARQPLSKLLRAGPDVIINPASHEVFVHGNLTPLQPAEYSLLDLAGRAPR